MKLLKRRLRERCFPVNFMKFLRIFLRIAYSGCFCIFKISVPLKEFTSSFDYNCLNLQNKCKIFTVNKIKKSVKDFSLLNTFFFLQPLVNVCALTLVTWLRLKRRLTYFYPEYANLARTRNRCKFLSALSGIAPTFTVAATNFKSWH